VDGVLKSISVQAGDTVTSQQVIAVIEEGAAAAAPASAQAPKAAAPKAEAAKPAAAKHDTSELSPAGSRVAEQEGIDPSTVAGTGRGGRVTKEDLVTHGTAGSTPAAASAPAASAGPIGPRSEQRVPMTRMRTRIAERMMQSKNSIAMLTSFNEVNLAQVMKMRKAMGEQFE